MSEEARCYNCRYFWGFDTADGSDLTVAGHCRKRAPYPVEGQKFDAKYPYVNNGDWCGDWEAAESSEPCELFEQAIAAVYANAATLRSYMAEDIDRDAAEVYADKATTTIRLIGGLKHQMRESLLNFVTSKPLEAKGAFEREARALEVWEAEAQRARELRRSAESK